MGVPPCERGGAIPPMGGATLPMQGHSPIRAGEIPLAWGCCPTGEGTSGTAVLHWSVEIISSRERHFEVLRLGEELNDVECAHIDVIGLGYVAQMPNIRSHMAMLRALIERWRSETSTFHLPAGEMTMTLEDVYRIMRLSIRGAQYIAGRFEQAEVVRLLAGGEIPLRWGMLSLDHAMAQAPLDRLIYIYVCALVNGYIIPDRGERFIVLGMIPVVVEAVHSDRPMAWGTLVLTKLYRELHEIIYHPGKGFRFITLL
ncbi:protein MAINTENANCE OF MERISTEMS-like [Cryptomeria japonica]|uniref:protein MAINTENANCE OF MERISTEMS-like n=1 Tax=Cryptomeria japonica TaxID=3369 RepID=UPI0027DA0DCF|nr:protein MAINTENANCE OF MERISTEMS-like [Cryptomeria japonica]